MSHFDHINKIKKLFNIWNETSYIKKKRSQNNPYERIAFYINENQDSETPTRKTDGVEKN